MIVVQVSIMRRGQNGEEKWMIYSPMLIKYEYSFILRKKKKKEEIFILDVFSFIMVRVQVGEAFERCKRFYVTI